MAKEQMSAVAMRVMADLQDAAEDLRLAVDAFIKSPTVAERHAMIDCIAEYKKCNTDYVKTFKR